MRVFSDVGLQPYIGIYCQGMQVDSQVILFNHYVEALERYRRSDVILIQYPGGMRQFDQRIPSDFGAFSYIVSQAVIPDYFFCCFQFMNYRSDYIKNYLEVNTYKYATPIITAFLSDLEVDVSLSHETNTVITSCVYTKIVEEKVKQLNNEEKAIKWYPILSEQKNSSCI